MRATLSERLFVSEADGGDPLLAPVLEGLRNRFTYENPVYWDARRFRRPCRHIPRKIELFHEDGPGAFSLPRGAAGFALEVLAPFSPQIDDRTAFPPSPSRVLRGALRDYQDAAVRAALAAREGVIQAPTGSGKTVIAMGLAARLHTPVLFLVHTAVLLDQTVDKVREFLGVEPGRVGGGHEDWADVTVAMVQTLQRRDLSDLRDRFGLVILDEAHHCPAETFKALLQRFAARYRIGLTATPTRKDRLHPVLYDVVGPILHAVAPRTLVATGSIAPTEVVEVETGYKGAYRNNYGALINRLARNKDRNALVVESVLRHRGGRSLVLSERVAHCALLAEALRQRGVPAQSLTGDMGREARDAVLRDFSEGRAEVLVSTTALVGEGFDLPAIDTVFLTVPNGNVAKTTQALGRALRPHEGKIAGRIVDFVDGEVPLLKNQFRKRSRVYRGFMGPGPADG